MDVTSFLLVLLKQIFWMGIGGLIAYNYVAYVERELKITSRYYYIRYLIALILFPFLVWVLLVTEGLELEKKHWEFFILDAFFFGIGYFCAVRILLYKHWDEYRDSKL